MNNPTLASTDCPPLPVAWMGYAAPDTIKICAWCSDKVTADRLAREQHFKVTHAICPRCYGRQLAALLGESAD